MRIVGKILIYIGAALALLGILVFIFDRISGNGGMSMDVPNLLFYIIGGTVLAFAGWIIQVLSDVQKKANQ